MFSRRPWQKPRRVSRHRPEVMTLEGRLVMSGPNSIASAVIGPGTSPQDVLTYHDNTSRTGSDPHETTLTPETVNAASFGKLFDYPVDGQVYAQPLYVQNIKMSDGKVHSVLYVATENDSVYALDAANPKAGPTHNGVLWHDSFINPSRGITPVPSTDVGVQDINPNIGITGTPVIDPATNSLYLVAATKVMSGKNALPTYVQTLYSLNLSSGRETPNGQVVIGKTTIEADGRYLDQTGITVPGTGAGAVDGVVKFNALRENERSGLALDSNVTGQKDGLIVIAYASHGDINPYHGWLLGYDAKTLKLKTLFNTTPNGDYGGIWQGGAAPSIDSSGNIIVTTGNGSFDHFTSVTPPGASALGDSGTGDGYSGINNSVAVKFDAADPSSGFSSTGLYFNGTFPVTDPTAPNVREGLLNTGINFNTAAHDTNGPHTFQASLAYDGSTLHERLTDLTTGATFVHNYLNVSIPNSVGGTAAFVGFGGGDDGLHSIENITNWTFTSGASGSPTLDFSGGFGSHGNLTANGLAQFSGTSAELTNGGGEEAGTIFSNQEVDIRSFSTSFDFQFAPEITDPTKRTVSTAPIGDGITFIVQAATGHPAGQDYGETVLKLSPTKGTMSVVDSFTPHNFENLIIKDQDPGSTATLLLPSFPGTVHPNLAVVAGKSGTIYLVDRDNLGGFNPDTDQVLQELSTNHGFFSSPAFANGKVYLQGLGDVLHSYSLVLNPSTNTMQLVPDTANAQTSSFPGTSPSVSSDGSVGGIVWTLQVDQFAVGGPAVLRAFDALNLANQLYSSSTRPSDQAGGAVKFVNPVVANGRVYAGLSNEVDVYGLLPFTKPMN